MPEQNKKSRFWREANTFQVLQAVMALFWREAGTADLVAVPSMPDFHASNRTVTLLLPSCRQPVSSAPGEEIFLTNIKNALGTQDKWKAGKHAQCD
jgi:hypothetical protein